MGNRKNAGRAPADQNPATENEDSNGKPSDETEGGEDTGEGKEPAEDEGGEGAGGGDTDSGAGGDQPDAGADTDQPDAAPAGEDQNGAAAEVSREQRPHPTLSQMVQTALANEKITHADTMRLTHLLHRFAELKVQLRQLELTTAPDLHDLLKIVERQL